MAREGAVMEGDDRWSLPVGEREEREGVGWGFPGGLDPGLG